MRVIDRVKEFWNRTNGAATPQAADLPPALPKEGLPAEGYTQAAVDILLDAYARARAAGAAEVSPRHVVGALAGCGKGVAGEFLGARGIVDPAGNGSTNTHGNGNGAANRTSPGFGVEILPLIEAATRQARRLHQDHLGTEHLLLACLETTEGSPAGDLRLDPMTVRRELIERLELDPGSSDDGSDAKETAVTREIRAKLDEILARIPPPEPSPGGPES